MHGGLKRLIRADDRAVSPVIGVILMVALTVILAGVAAVALFDIANLEQIIELAESIIDGSRFGN